MNSSESGVKLIVGLGNPGAEYQNTRHNVGFMVIEKLLSGLPAGRFVESFTAESRLFSGRYRGRNLFLQLPQTYMNLSGNAVGAFARRQGISPEEILVISDDLDLPVGRLRLRQNGSDGGHNGLKSIISELNSERFKRLRVGIGRQDSGKVADYVLSEVSADESALFAESLENAVKAVHAVLSSGMARAMNQYNTRVQEKSQ